MYRFLCVVIGGLFIAGCMQEGVESSAESAAGSDATAAADSIEPELELTGVQAYQTVCATCHESGLNGAPVTGDASAWTERSTHWEAVLFDHAKNGYMDMPARGGKPQLSDRSVVAAAEYMLSVTYPDRPAN
jgi:cytochrome c5